MNNYENDPMMKVIDFYNAKKQELGYDTVWSAWSDDKIEDLDKEIFENKNHLVKYSFISQDATMDELVNDDYKWVTVTAVAEDGTLGSLWKAAESCYQQAKALGDWHYFVEGFEMSDDGSLEMVAGS